jgi:prepilin-type N-terminal cleavage/methylation domain-containing protein
MLRLGANSKQQGQAGFSLMELAVVLMIIGTLMGGILAGVSNAAESGRRTQALSQLREIEAALIGYAQANGHLPCPSTHTTEGKADPVTNGACTVMHGFVPSTTLGLNGRINDDGLLLDPWQNPYRYSVASSTVSSGRAFTSTAGLKELFNDSELSTITNTLRVCDAAACSGVVMADRVPALVFSMGADWATYNSADETENAGTTLGAYDIADDADFASTEFVEDVFDDQLVWISPHILFNKLISAGKLP